MNPAALLGKALEMSDLETRLVEALPWVAWRHPDLDWTWLIARAKAGDLQNRLGFVVSLAREVATRRRDDAAAAMLASVEERLDRSRLVREDTLCRASMTQAERRWLARQRPALAAHWNLLTDLRTDHLSYAA
jgi:hypothetical protein